jgi:hypothetical protein
LKIIEIENSKRKKAYKRVKSALKEKKSFKKLQCRLKRSEKKRRED